MTMPPIESLTEARDRLNAIAGSGTVPSPADAQQLRDLVDDAIAGLEPPRPTPTPAPSRSPRGAPTPRADASPRATS